MAHVLHGKIVFDSGMRSIRLMPGAIHVMQSLGPPKDSGAVFTRLTRYNQRFEERSLEAFDLSRTAEVL